MHLRKVYIGETKRKLETRLKEHKDVCIKYLTDKSAIAEHTWMNVRSTWSNKDFSVNQSHHGAYHERSTKHTDDTWKHTLQKRQRVWATWL